MPVLVVSVNVAETDICLIPLVVHAGAEILPENVKLPPDTVALLVNDAPLSVGFDPKLVRLEPVTPLPNVVALSTLAPLIS